VDQGGQALGIVLGAQLVQADLAVHRVPHRGVDRVELEALDRALAPRGVDGHAVALAPPHVPLALDGDHRPDASALVVVGLDQARLLIEHVDELLGLALEAIGAGGDHVGDLARGRELARNSTRSGDICRR
jgi:hypothetical protein